MGKSFHKREQFSPRLMPSSGYEAAIAMMSANTNVRWTVADLEVLPEDGRRYEIIDGELFVTRAPHWKHQNVSVKIGMALEGWSVQSGLGEAAVNPGLVFSEIDSVIPDMVWASHERLDTMLDEAGNLIAAPELVVEILSPGEKNERRDKDAKLKIYSLPMGCWNIGSQTANSAS